MTQREQITYHPAWVGRLVEQRPVSREDAKMLSRLATRAQELASEHGIVLARKEALQRVRGNLAHVMAMAEDTRVREGEWLP